MSVSVTTNQLAYSRLIAVETESLGGNKPENETDNFCHCMLDLVRLALC